MTCRRRPATKGTQRAASLPPAAGHVQPGSLGASVRAFKGAVSRRIHEQIDAPEMRVWQGRYHDRVVRDDGKLERIRAHIEENPIRWAEDDENPANIPGSTDPGSVLRS